MKRFLFLLVLAVGVTSCSKDDITNDMLPEGAIGFSNGTLTRGTPIQTAGGILSMGVFCGVTDGDFVDASSNPANYMDNVNVSRKDASMAFSYSPFQYWPAETSKKLSFFAYAPHSSTLPTNSLSFTTTGGIPKLTYTVPTDVTKQPDLMVATSRKSLTKTNGRVDFSMTHVLTAVGFKVAGQGEKVKAVKISGVRTTGTLVMEGSKVEWSNLNEPQTTEFTAGTKNGTEITDMTDIMNGNGYLMMIPQTLATGAKLIITLDNDKTKEVSLEGRKWAAGETVTYSVTLTPNGTIVIDPANLYLPAAAVTAETDNIEVVYTPDSGSTPSTTDNKWTLTSADSWLSLSLTLTGVGATSVSGNGSTKVYILATTNTGSSERATTLSINRRPENVVCNVAQLKPVDFNAIENAGTVIKSSYVGAFWRADQKGERIIRIPVGTDTGNQGKWRASVAWVDSKWKTGDIVLSTEASKDTSIDFGNTATTPGNAEDFPVKGNSTVVGGTVGNNEYIYFRIGLNSTFSASEATPARYAVVVLSYNDNTKQQKIFLRQGQDPDYLMRKDETGTTNSTLASRPYAKRFAVYNVTTDKLNAAVSSSNPSKFVDYPSQGGALFQWASKNNPKYAYSPIGALPEIIKWDLEYLTTYWDNFQADYDVFPQNVILTYGKSVNFRYPQDGSTSAAATGKSSESECRQSLFLTPMEGENFTQINNNVYGYYADGFFDRLALVAVSKGELLTVSSGGKIGCGGRVFFNPATNASLFFPAGGYRGGDGALVDVGLSGTYWTSSSNYSVWYIGFAEILARLRLGGRYTAFTIRPVID